MLLFLSVSTVTILFLSEVDVARCRRLFHRICIYWKTWKMPSVFRIFSVTAWMQVITLFPVSVIDSRHHVSGRSRCHSWHLCTGLLCGRGRAILRLALLLCFEWQTGGRVPYQQSYVLPNKQSFVLQRSATRGGANEMYTYSFVLLVTSFRTLLMEVDTEK